MSLMHELLSGFERHIAYHDAERTDIQLTFFPLQKGTERRSKKDAGDAKD